ncbi:MAG: PHB depolymerase family esterase [Pseudomonadota bacterium]
MSVNANAICRVIFSLIIFLVITLVGPRSAQADFIYGQLLVKDPTLSKSDDRRYTLYLPSQYNGNTPVPLVIALHGCHQTERTVADDSRLEEVAEREGFIVAYPYIAKSDNSGETNDEGGRNPRCWGFWFADEIHRGNGEVGDIARLVDQLKSRYRIDANRVHILGISSGGAMATDALVAYPDKFASGAILDGVGYAETSGVYTGAIDCDIVLNNNLGNTRPNADVIRDMRTEMSKSILRQVPVMVVHNKKDCTVPSKVGKAIVEQFAGLLAQEGRSVNIGNPISSTSGTTAGVPWTQNKYGNTSNGTSVIETVYLDSYYKDLQRIETRLSSNQYLPSTPAPNDIDRGHAWFGAKRGPWFVTVGPVTAELAWTFFKDHPYEAATGIPVVSCNAPAVSGRSVALTCSGTDNGTIASYHIVLGGPSSMTETLPGGNGFSRTYDNLPDGEYSVSATATDDQGTVSSPARSTFTIGSAAQSCVTTSNPTHVANGRAYPCGMFLLMACANGSDETLGFNFAWTTNSLKQTGANNWARVDRCQ